MTVSSTTNRKTFSGNGVTTSFATSPVVFFDTSDLVLTVVTDSTGASETLVENTDYTVTGGAGTTGTVSLAGGSSPYGAPAVGTTLVIRRVLPLTQEDDFLNNDINDAEVMEDALDRLVMVAQQLDEGNELGVRLSSDETATDDLTVLPFDRASKYLGFGASKELVALAAPTNTALTTAYSETLLAAANAADARTVLGAPAIADIPAAVTAALDKTVPQCGRLTLTSATPITTGDVTGATTVYFTPYKGNVIALYDGTDWVPAVFSELSQATTDSTKSPAAVANSSNYDVFVWNDAGTLRATRGPAWTSDTARGTGAGTTELEVLEGRYVNKVAITNGPAARRGLYVGTVRSDGSAQINDSLLLRHIWNNYNRVCRPMRAIDATNSWTYTTASYRQANASTANQLDYLAGLSEDCVSARVDAYAANTGVINSAAMGVGVGVDSTTVNSAQITITPNVVVANGVTTPSAIYRGYPGIGRHFLAWLEYSTASGTTTWSGDANITTLQTGITGEVFA